MDKREKVINGMLHCIGGDDCNGDKWSECEYSGHGCIDALLEDALALLKAQEPRLVTEADFENADPYGYLPVWVEDKDDNEIICDCITKYAITEPDEDYHYRYWTFHPTDAQREATPWERLN